MHSAMVLRRGMELGEMISVFPSKCTGVKEQSFSSCSVVGVTAGASTPEFIIRSVCERLESFPGNSS